jgi:hypothetical protein
MHPEARAPIPSTQAHPTSNVGPSEHAHAAYVSLGTSLECHAPDAAPVSAAAAVGDALLPAVLALGEHAVRMGGAVQEHGMVRAQQQLLHVLQNAQQQQQHQQECQASPAPVQPVAAQLEQPQHVLADEILAHLRNFIGAHHAAQAAAAAVPEAMAT